MIKLTGQRTKKAVPSGLRGAGRFEKNLAVLKLKRANSAIPSEAFKGGAWKPAKRQLRAESHNKCAYCEADTTVVAHGDVEHFRPKTVYWWLAYCYDNYLYSCQICNQLFKGDRFPISGVKLPAPIVRKTSTDDQLKRLAQLLTPDPVDIDTAPTLSSFLRATEREEADLMNPYEIDPEPLITYEADEVNEVVRIEVAAEVTHREARQRAIDEVYGLNREELMKVRYIDYGLLKTLCRVATEIDDPVLVQEVRRQIRRMMADDHRFAGMCRYFVRKLWQLEVG